MTKYFIYILLLVSVVSYGQNKVNYINQAAGVDRTELGDTATNVSTRSNNYTDAQVVNYSVSLLSDLSNLDPSTNETAFVGETAKNYYWDGISWNEISSSVLVTDNKISFSQSAIEEIIDYDQLDTLDFVNSNSFNVGTSSPVTFWNIARSNGDYLISGNKRATLTVADTTLPHNATTFSDYVVVFDSVMNYKQGHSFGTTVTNNSHSIFDGNNNVYLSMVTTGTFTVKSSVYSTTNGVDGYVILLDGTTYLADTVYPIFSGIGTQQTNHGYYDIYTDLIYYTGRTQNAEFTIHSTDGNDTVISQTAYSLTIVEYDTNFVIQDFITMPVSYVGATNTEMIVTQNYIYWLSSIRNDLTIEDSTFSTPASVNNPFVVKFDKDFNFVYARTISSSSTSTGYALEVDANDNVRLSFTVGGNYTIQTSNTAFSSTKSNIYGGTDACEVVWDSDGDYVSDYIFGGSGNDLIQGSINNKDLSFVSGYSTSTTMTIGDSTLNHGVTDNDPFYMYINNTTGDLISGQFVNISAQAAQMKRIIKSSDSDYAYGTILIDDPTGGTIDIGDSTYTLPSSGNQFSIPFRFGAYGYKKILGVNNDKAFIGDYYNSKYVVYDTTTKSLIYVGTDSTFADNEIPTMYAVEQKISDIDSLRADTIKTNEIQGLDSDTTTIETTVDFKQGIRADCQQVTFSVDMDISFKSAHCRHVIITNNCNLTAKDIPEGISVKLWVTYTGSYTVTIDGDITQMEDNTATLQETNGAYDLMQFEKRPFDNEIRYVIINDNIP